MITTKEMELYDTSILEPELLGPVFKIENITLRQALYVNNTNRRIRLLATFVPDELIFLIEDKDRFVKYEFVILYLIDISALYGLFDEFSNADKAGSAGLSRVFNTYTSVIIEKICYNGGDVINFSDNGILSMWKEKPIEEIYETMQTIISCTFAMKESIEQLESDDIDLTHIQLKFAIAAGSITFATIGHDEDHKYMILGDPVNGIRKALSMADYGELILTAQAWERCKLSDYVHMVFEDGHVKIIEELNRKNVEPPRPSKISMDSSKGRRSTVSAKTRQSSAGTKGRQSTDERKDRRSTRPSESFRKSLNPVSSSRLEIIKNRRSIAITLSRETERQIIQHRHSILEACKTQLGIYLKTVVITKVLDQIENDEPISYLTEMRNLTIVLLEVAPTSPRTIHELIRMANECHKIIVKHCETTGCIEDIYIREGHLVFRIIFGSNTFLKNVNHCRFGILCSWKLLRALKHVAGVGTIYIGVSTGIVCCTVIGHNARRHYAIIGGPTIKAESIMLISANKVMCDLDTVVYSGIKKSNFSSAGLINVRAISEKRYVFGFIDKDTSDDADHVDLKDAYPILSSFEVLEIFGNILDDIGLADREYAGILIEGADGIGKSRVLDAYVSLVKARQISIIKLILHPSFATRPYVVIYKILEQMLDAEDCKTVDELMRNITKKLGHSLQPDDFCYLNKILRVQFKLSPTYIQESDWTRHCKAVIVFEKILKIFNSKLCIMLDNVHYMDFMSWQFLEQAINTKNIVLAMTLLEATSWEELSRVESDICKDKRLMRHTLTGIDSGHISVLICQFLGVQAISIELYNFLVESEITHPGWCELFLTMIILHNGFDFANLTPNEAAELELIFPQTLLINRISADLQPEETAPPVPWNKRHEIPICLTNEKFEIAETLKDYNLEELSLEIFYKLTAYEQVIVSSASIIGKMFGRDVLEKILPDHQSLKTSTAIENLMRVRILECASLQRRTTKVGDPNLCSFRSRSTFSDMHHLLRCRCHLQYVPQTEKHLSRYAHCRLMEFKVGIFKHTIYEQIPEKEKITIHSMIVDIYKKEARKCVACGGGSFSRIPGKEKSRKSVKTSIIIKKNNEPHRESKTPNKEKEKDKDKKDKKKKDKADKKREESKKTVDSKDDFENDMNDLSGFSMVRSSLVDDAPADAKGKRIIVGEKIQKPGILQMYRRAKIQPILQRGEVKFVQLNNFGHIDVRNCRCFSIIDCTFMKVHQHIEYINKNEKVVSFLIDYAAALILHAQPSYALRFLAQANERNEYVSTFHAWKNPSLYGKIIKKSYIFRLRGDAFMLLGNYPQAKSNYISALALYKNTFSTGTFVSCYRMKYHQLKEHIHWTFSNPIVNVYYKSERVDIIRQNTASCLRHVSIISMLHSQTKPAKLAALQSITSGFATYDANNFYDQCQLYLTVVKVFGELGEFPFLNHVERYILFAIECKQRWNHNDDIIILSVVYTAIFNVSLVQGNLEKAVLYGEKALRVAKAFHVIKLEFEILPALIQALMRLKRIYEMMDMLEQLRDIAMEDVDKSGLTWYYAICMDLLLDIGISMEDYEVCANYATKILSGKSDACVMRDPRSLRRLVSNLWAWQLRKGDLTSVTFVKTLDFFMTDIEADNYLQLITLCKVLECHLILLTRCVNMKKGEQMELLLSDIMDLMDFLSELSKNSHCTRPYFYLLKAYFELQHGRVLNMNTYLRKAMRCAGVEKNIMTSAWILRNKNTWNAVSYENMARFWEENVGYRNSIVWQDVDMFDVEEWSNILYALPTPDTSI